MAHTYIIDRQQDFRQSREELFGFFADAANLSTITPPFLGFRILTPLPIDMRAGARLDYTIKLYGLPLKWKTLIESFEAPSSFVDRQISGPYRLWHHTHTFEPHAGGTRMRDVVRYELPLGPLGRGMHALMIKRTLKNIFDFREETLRSLFGSASQAP
jgi:ligand-binding SRPBCC domain-containing protein